jgi:hypothetical protein
MERIRTREFKALERAINDKLRRVSPNYGVRNLYRTGKGVYYFDLKVKVDPRHEGRLRDIVREILRELPGDRSVQAKYYLPESVVKRVRAVARKRGVSQSSLVTECLEGKVRL